MWPDLQAGRRRQAGAKLRPAGTSGALCLGVQGHLALGGDQRADFADDMTKRFWRATLQRQRAWPAPC